jgi:hypothetical protein
VDVIAHPAPGLQWPKDEERRGRVDAALNSRESPAAVTELALPPPRPIREEFAHRNVWFILLCYVLLFHTVCSLPLFATSIAVDL